MKNVLSSSAFPSVVAEVLTWAGGLLLMLVLWYLLLGEKMDLLAALLIAGVLLLVCLRDRATGAILTLGYLTIMGDVRRMVAATFGEPKLDLLLLVAPGIAIILALPALLRLRFKESLSQAMFALLIVMALEMFNPQQGGLVVGVTGALFYIVPVLWFFVGRQLASPVTIERLLYRCIFPLAVFAAVMGICQTFIGFLPYQQSWINIVSKSYASLHVGASIRAFGFSVSSAEYATLLTLAATGIAAGYFGRRRLWLAAFPLLVVAIVLASSRGLVIKLIFALAIVWTLRKGGKLNTVGLLRLGIIMVVGLVGLFVVASRLSSGSKPIYEKGAAAQNALEHQTNGFAHPLDQRSSTAGVHAKLIGNGLLQGIIAPLGHGLGATTVAAKRFGGDASTGSSEIDFSDMFISLGLIGGLIYLFIIYKTLRYVLRYVNDVPKAVSLPMLAILATTLSAWLIGGQYSTSSMIFFLIGALVYEDNRPGNGAATYLATDTARQIVAVPGS